MNLLLLILVLALLFGGGGFYSYRTGFGGPYGTYGMGLGGIVLLVVIVMLLSGRL
jgi:hypothetical protein